jgi:hypothetical protein
LFSPCLLHRKAAPKIGAGYSCLMVLTAILDIALVFAAGAGFAYLQAARIDNPDGERS